MTDECAKCVADGVTCPEWHRTFGARAAQAGFRPTGRIGVPSMRARNEENETDGQTTTGAASAATDGAERASGGRDGEG